MTTQLTLYKEISHLSQRMVNAARANDWDSLVELEHHVAALRDKLIATDVSLALSTPDLQHKQSLIQQILEDDAEIRRHTEPWMERMHQFLDTPSAQHTPPTRRRKPTIAQKNT